jgi:hypothetical protein
MPVPSTMIAFSDTMVFVPEGREVSTQAFIIGSGPMATTRSGWSVAITSCRAEVTNPGFP